jgi:predicted  nucleic acid-binding Zn-ribbon protein
MSGELTPGEVRQRLEDIRHHIELGAEIAVRMSGELGDHIDWLTSELSDRDEEITGLREAHYREESMRVDAENQLKQAERELEDLRNQIDYWKMSQ